MLSRPGFRFDNFMIPEEKNNIFIDHLATRLFCFSATARNNLIQEGIDDKKIVLSGSTLIWNIHKTLRDQYFRRDEKGTALVSLHRSQLLENKKILQTFFRMITQKKIPTNFIIHRAMSEKSPRSQYITLHTNPLSYESFIKQLAQASYIITDSSTISEEACFLGIPCITLLSKTNRPETVTVGANILVDPFQENKIFREELEKAIYLSVRKKRTWEFPYGDLKSTIIIINEIMNAVKK